MLDAIDYSFDDKLSKRIAAEVDRLQAMICRGNLDHAEYIRQSARLQAFGAVTQWIQELRQQMQGGEQEER